MKDKQHESKIDTVKVMGEALQFFDDVVVRETIYRLNMQRVQLLEEISKLESIQS